MRWGLTLRALCIAAAVTACGINHALAQQADDQEEEETSTVEKKASGWSVLFDPVISKKPAFDFLTGGMPDRLLYFTGLDIWRCGFGGYAGMQWAPKGINKDGFILRLFASESLERYTTTRRRYETQIFRGSVMPGIRFKRGNFEMQLLGGLDVEADYLLINRRLAALRSRIGARFTTDIWWEPTRSLMLQYSLSGTMIDDGINTRVAAGWRLFDRFWIGPEASLSSDFFGQQYRIGAHLTGLRTGDYEWSIAAGHVQDSFQREGIYGRLGITVRPPREPFFEN
ncbi:MAG: Cellulose biosynthesis protein BcsS [Tardiphaga sp.]|nr:Cellulose biosynthesis protein BcsS [Tardiphaga sp.]